MSSADDTSPQTSSLLRDDFPSVETGAWRREVDRLLKGAPFDKAMIATLAGGLQVQPLHTAADLADGIWGASLPGRAPFLRGARDGASGPVPWLIAQELAGADAGAFNLALLHDLERGQTAINLKLDVAGRRGLDAGTAPPHDVGRDGTSIGGLADLRRALASVDLAACPLLLQAGAATLPVATMLATIARERGTPVSSLAGIWGCDPLAVACGPVPALGLDTLYDHAALLTRWAGQEAPGLRTIAVVDSPWHEAGADGVLSLGLTLAAAVSALRELESRGIEPSACAPHVAFQASLDTDFFLDIARLRALRVLWSDVLAACGVEPERQQPAWVHARTGERMLSRLDPHTNLLRATTAAMAAACGGADSLHVAPWDSLLARPGGAGRRLARNLQLILGHECRFGAVADPAGGSWYVETLTRQLGEGAWEVFRQVEAAGGLRAALASGLVDSLVGEAARRRAARLARAQDARVGVNRYCPARPAIGDDADDGRDGSAEWLAERRAAAASAPIDPLTIDPRAEASAQLRAVGEAAMRGGSLAALVDALGGRSDAGRSAPWTLPPAGRDAEPFEALVARAKLLAARDPRLVRAHCLCLGDAARTGPRLDFARGCLAVAGLDITVGAFHQDPAAAAAEARAGDAAVVLLVGLDETYPTLGAATAALLAGGPRPQLLLAAGRPSASTEPLERAGVSRYLHLGSDLVAELGAVLDTLGGES
jgi:methylmalonyl-CoA mutase